MTLDIINEDDFSEEEENLSDITIYLDDEWNPLKIQNVVQM